MTEVLSAAVLRSLSDLLVAQMGLNFPSNSTADLERGIRAAAKEFNFHNPQACVEWLLASPLTKHQIETLASQLTVGETYFFRERPALQALEEQVMPELLRSHARDRRLRIWSAGCATGEEPFSLAILLARMLPNLPEWNISILATDINPRSLQKASAGVYTTWSFRDCPAGITTAYFKKTDERRWEIRTAIKKMVTFSYLNLVEDVYPSLLNETNALDLIFCRNVLMYFASGQAKRVIQRFHRCLLDGGWLIVSAAEASQVLYSEFSTINFPGAILYRKDSQGAPPFDAPPFQAFEDPSPGLPAVPVSVAQPTPPDAIRPAFSEIAMSEMAGQSGQGPTPPPPDDPFVQYEEGRYSEAAVAAAALLTEKPDDVRAMVVLARALANQGQLAQALEWCDKAIAAEKLDPAFHYLRATILQEQGEAGGAAKSLTRALYLDHRFVLAHFALGNLNRSLGKAQEAEKQFRNVLSLLNQYRQEEILPASEGITAGRLREIIVASRNAWAGVKTQSAT
jgi:chemotaxis protein methyltransferase CheR